MQDREVVKCKGHTIQASCLHRILPKFDQFFKLDQCIVISRHSLAPYNTSINHTKNNQKLTFNMYTQIQRTVDWKGPKYCFSFVKFRDVVENVVPINSPVDFIGYVEACFNLEDTNKKDGTKGKRLNLKLKDIYDQQVTATLWDDFAIEMHGYFNNPNHEKHVVVLVHFGVVNMYKDQPGLSTSFDISKMWIIAELEEISSFKNSFTEKFASIPSSSDNVGSYLISSVEDSFMNNPSFVLTAFLGTIEKKKVILVGTVLAICSGKNWYYNACNYCKSGVEESFITVDKDDGSGEVEDRMTVLCTNTKCKGVDIVSLPRFKIPIRVQDSSGTVTLTLFDYVAYKIFKKTAKELLEVQDEELSSGDFSKGYPDVFNILIGQKMAFIISVSDFNLKYHVENYGISMLTSDPKILSALYEKFKIQEYEKSESSSVQLSDIQSIPCDVSKDDVSFSGDNQTPMSNLLHNDHKSSSSGEVKRNLHEMYDVDDMVGCSSTKRRLGDEKEEVQNSESSNLLIPKIEK
ncbi:putative nucleic acid-binding, replication factor A [Helianthus debilis subsp. tardiflorus]